MEIEQNVWGFTPEGEAVLIYKMRNAHGGEVALTNYGAAVVSVTVPDRDGRLGDVVTGYGSFSDYAGDGAQMGKILGRYAGRIGNGKLPIDGIEYRLPRNSPPHTLHGGAAGFGEQVWQSRVEVDRVVMSLLSPDGDQGFPGELSVEVVYDWDDDFNLEITLLAKSEADTVVNLTSHIYFNLAGAGTGAISDHILRLDADRFLQIDRTLLPTGTLATVEGTPMDFRCGKPLGQDIDFAFDQLACTSGYDHCWAVNGWKKGELRTAGSLSDPASGRTMEIATTQPGIQVYTGNFLSDAPVGKHGARYADRGAVAIACMGFPDAPNQPGFPTQILSPAEIYQEKIIYRFRTS